MNTLTMPKDYLTQLLQNMQTQLEALNSKQDEQSKMIDKIHIQTVKTNGRMTQAEKELEALRSKAVPVKSGIVLPVINDKFLTLMALAAVMLVIIVAAGLKVDVSKVIP